MERVTYDRFVRGELKGDTDRHRVAHRQRRPRVPDDLVLPTRLHRRSQGNLQIIVQLERVTLMNNKKRNLTLGQKAMMIKEVRRADGRMNDHARAWYVIRVVNTITLNILTRRGTMTLSRISWIRTMS